jgi:hypothetical protein
MVLRKQRLFTRTEPEIETCICVHCVPIGLLNSDFVTSCSDCEFFNRRKEVGKQKERGRGSARSLSFWGAETKVTARYVAASCVLDGQGNKARTTSHGEMTVPPATYRAHACSAPAPVSLHYSWEDCLTCAVLETFLVFEHI